MYSVLGLNSKGGYRGELVKCVDNRTTASLKANNFTSLDI